MMRGASATVKALVRANLDSLRPVVRGRPDDAEAAAIEEASWACLAERVGAAVLDVPPRDAVAVGSAKVRLAVGPAVWRRLESELGWTEAAGRSAFVEVLRGHLLPDTARRRDGGEPALCDLVPDRLLVLLLLTALLEHIGRDGRPRYFGYSFHELRRLAHAELDWAHVGPFDELGLTTRFFDYCGVPTAHTDRLLQTPYFAYWRTLYRRLAHLPGLRTGAPDAPLPPLPAGALRAAPVEEAPPPAPRDGGVAEALVVELNRLRVENDGLRDAAGAPLLAQLLTPILDEAGDPLAAVEAAAAGATGLARSLALALRTILHAPELELIGEPGTVLQVRLPSQDYRLQTVGDAGAPRGELARCRVSRRGIRYRSVVLAPALVTLAQE